MDALPCKPYYYNQFGERSIGERKWKPHPCNALAGVLLGEEISRKEGGPDWTSSIRCPLALSPHISHEIVYKTIKSGRRYFPGVLSQTWNEWIIYPYATGNGIRCMIEGEIKANKTSLEEIYLENTIGKRRKVFDSRGGIAVRKAGDKSYHTPEYSKGFHKVGSTLPAVSFSRSSKVIADTFIPLNMLPVKPRESYVELEKQRRKAAEEKEVLCLDQWRPADPLKAGF